MNHMNRYISSEFNQQCGYLKLTISYYLATLEPEYIATHQLLIEVDVDVDVDDFIPK